MNKNEQYSGDSGSDRYVREHFFPDFSYKGTMIEVGAGPPEFYSVSKHFRDNGWRCICIEPNPKFVEQHKALGNEIYQYACSDKEEDESSFTIITTDHWAKENSGISMSSLGIRVHGGGNIIKTEIIKVRVRTLNSILEELNIKKIDYVSIDVEGWELEIMRGFDTDKYQPKIIQLEENNTLCEKYMDTVGYKKQAGVTCNPTYVSTKF